VRARGLLHVLHGPYDHGTDIVRHGQPPQGKQWPCCREQRWAVRISLQDEPIRPLLDSRVVDVPMVHNLSFVILSSLKPLFFNSLKNELRFSDNAGASDPGIQ
jgi:hypothetical protein